MVSAQLQAQLEAQAIEVLHVGQFDYAGVFRERRLGRAQFEAWARAPRFANTLPKWDCADALFAGGPYLTETVAIDEASLRRYPFEANAGLIIADFSGDSASLMPRAVLRRQIERAAAMGFAVQAAFEFEVIFLNETADSLRASQYAAPRQFAPDNKCWSGQTAAEKAGFVGELVDLIEAHDIALFALAGELGPGCFEATLGAVDGLRAADNAGLVRQAIRAFARSRDMTASFMPYIGPGYPSIGGHINLSLADAATGANLFTDPQGQTNGLARRFIAGMTRLVPEAFALCAHTVNAYRRFAPGSWAPKSLTWADWTFTTAVRSAPSAFDDARLEFRLPGADCNPHLALALMLGAGLDGIEQQLVAPDPTPDLGPDDIQPGAARFPATLAEAADRLQAGADAARVFGQGFVDHFASVCRVESNSLARAVSAAELARYIEG
jgi:glutamine synthetase